MKRTIVIPVVFFTALALASGGGYIVTSSAVTGLTASRALVSSAGGALTTATTTATEIGYVNGVTSALQTQLNAKAPLDSPAFTTLATFSYGTATTVPYWDASKNLVSSATTPTELGYVHGVTSALQTQLGAKAATGANGDITSLTAATGVTTAAGFAVHGTNTNDSASAGYVGEYLEQTNSTGTQFGASNTFINVTASPLALTAGDWVVSAMCLTYPNGTTHTVSGCDMGVSTSSTAATFADKTFGVNWIEGYGGGASPSYMPTLTLANYRVSLSGSTNYYLKCSCTYSGGSTAPKAYGRMSGWRVR
jgi:hypothetical protein